MEETNFYQLDLFSLYYDMYMFIDTAEHLADQIFIRHKLRIRFKGDYQKEGQKYQVILCKAPKKRRSDFVECMKDLTRKMLLLGNTDYCDFCRQVQDQILRHLQTKRRPLEDPKKQMGMSTTRMCFLIESEEADRLAG